MGDAPAEDVAPQGAATELKPASLFDQVAAPFLDGGEKGKVFGIDRKMLGDFLNYRGEASKEQLAGLSRDIAREILFTRFWKAMGLDDVPEEIAGPMFEKAYAARDTLEGNKLLQRGIRSTINVALNVDGRAATETRTALGQIVKDGKAIALAENIIAHRMMSPLRLGLGKPPKHLQRFAKAAVFIGKAALFAKTGVKLP